MGVCFAVEGAGGGCVRVSGSKWVRPAPLPPPPPHHHAHARLLSQISKQLADGEDQERVLRYQINDMTVCSFLRCVGGGWERGRSAARRCLFFFASHPML